MRSRGPAFAKRPPGEPPFGVQLEAGASLSARASEESDPSVREELAEAMDA